MGVAEQNMAATASGFAAAGKVPFITSYGVFSPGRNNEQIRTTIAINNRPVKIVGSHGGLAVGPDGATHQALEDIALMRAMPNMTVFSPCDSEEARKVTYVVAKTDKPAYIRLCRAKTPVLTSQNTPFVLGKAQTFFGSERPQVGIIATGPILYNAILAAEELEKKGIGVEVVNLSTIKPLDQESIISLAQRCEAIVTVEDHQIAGGMGGAVAECLAKKFPVPIEFVGVEDKFGQSGTPEELEKHYGLDKNSIIEKVKKVMDRKLI